MRLLYEHLTEIPANFTEVEYLKSDGLSLMYITPDLSYFPDFEVGVKCDANSDRNATLGVDGNNMLERSSASNPYWTLHASGTIFMSNVGVGTYADAKYKDGVFSVNGVTVGTKENTFQSGTLCLFKPHTGNNNLYKMSIYFFKAWDSNGNLVRDLVPCLDNNNTPCMYDKVEGKAYYNAGTGSFTYGRKIIPVEYLESSGTQYIDTGLNPTDSWGYKLRNTYTVGGGEQCAIGCMDSGNRFVGVYTSGSENAISGGWGSFVGFLPNYTWTTGTILDVKCNYKNNRKIIIDETEMKDITDIHISGTINNTLCLFGRNSGGVTKMQGKIYGVEITNGNDVVGDFIPSKDENNVCFMFDKVSHKVYLNTGTGDFVVGKTLPKKKLRLIKDTKRRVPKGFTEVEYLESTGTQYINLNYIPTDTTGYKMGQVIPTSNSRDNIIIGCRQATNSDSRFWQDIDWSAANKTIGWGFGGYSPSGQRYSIVGKAGNYVVTSLNYMNDRAGKVDGVSYDTSLESKTLPEISRPMYLFAGNNGGTDGYYVSTKIYFVQMTEGNKIVRDFIPCLDNNNTPCMYDLIENKAYYNAGTGTFNYGHTITPVEYLESTGTQYIDTGIKFDGANTKIELKTYEDSLTRRHSICGDDGNFFYYFRGTGNWAVGYNGTASNIDLYMSVGDNVFVIDKNNVYVNGVLAKTYTASSSVSAYNALLFNRKTSLVDNGAVTMYYCKIWNNNVLVRDFIPVKDENNVGYMLDKVSHTLYNNKGTGNFSVGDELKDLTRFLKG